MLINKERYINISFFKSLFTQMKTVFKKRKKYLQKQ